MIDRDCTLTSPLSELGREARPLLALTIVWHPEQQRIGEQFVAGAGTCDVELSRYSPSFFRLDGEGLPLGHGRVSRDPLRLVRDEADNVTMSLPASRMSVELNGKPVEGTVRLTAAQLGQGQVLTLGRAIVVCLHWLRSFPKRRAVPGLVGVGSAAMALREQIELVAPTDMPVLLLGETGTGKEVVARAIHSLGRRASERLVTVNMAALNESLAIADLFGAAKGAYTGGTVDRQGLFAEADGGTIFLDEIGNAPPSIQPMLLRVLEGGDYRPLGATRDRHTTARLIAATDQKLDAAVFNQALLRRLEGFVIRLPPLRERREDIGVLVAHVLQQGAAVALPVEFVTELACHDWPGNVRQLVHTVRRAALQLHNGVAPKLDDLIGLEAGGSERAVRPATATDGVAAAPAAPARRKPSELSDADVLEAMVRHGWTIRSAAQALHISRPSFYKLLDCNAQIRRVHSIPDQEIARAMQDCGGDMARCAALLMTPVEPLRRHWRRMRQGA